MFVDSEVHISFSAASDSGLEYGATFELEGEANTSTDRQVDESSLYIKGDFGKLILGQNDYASDSFITWMPTSKNSFSQDDNPHGFRFAAADCGDNSDAECSTNASYYAGNASYNDNPKITYMAPSLGGFNFGVSWTDGDSGDGSDAEADTAFGFSYTHGGGMMDDGMMGGLDLTLTANSLDNGEDGTNSSKSNSYGVTVGLDAITLAASMANAESGGGADVSTSGFGAGYSVNDQLALGFSVSSSEDDSNGDELSTSSITASYTITPGLGAYVSLDNYELTPGASRTDGAAKNEGTITSFSIQANF